MFRWILIPLIVFYTAIALSLTVSISYCGEKIVDIQFWKQAKNCCKIPKKCCKKFNLSFELNENYKPNLTQKFTQKKFFKTVGIIRNSLTNTQSYPYFPVQKLSFTFADSKNIVFQYLYLKFCSLKLGNFH